MKLTKRPEVGKFYSDVNLWMQPVFSASKNPDKRFKVIEIQGKNKTLTVKVEYGRKVPTWLEKRTLWVVEALFGKRFDYKEIKDEYEIAFSRELEKFEKEVGRSPSEIDSQHIIYNVMDGLRQRYRMYVDIGEIADILYPGQRATTALRNSLMVLNETQILAGSRFYFGDEKAELYIERLPLLHLSASGTSEGTVVSVSLNPFHLYNLMTKRIIGADLGFILRIEKPIAGLAYCYLHPKLYGAKMYGNKTYSVAYEDFATALQISVERQRRRILMQVGDGLDELVAKQFIMSWRLDDDAGYRLVFVITPDYFREYYEHMMPSERERIEALVNTLDGETYQAYVSEFLTALPKKKEWMDTTRMAWYYVRYRLATM